MDPNPADNKRYSISEVVEQTGVSQHVLRQWEERFRQLRPQRSRAGQRIYERKDIEIILRIKTLLQHEGMTTRGARLKLARELREVGHPKNKQELLDMVDKIAEEARAILQLFDLENNATTSIPR